MKVGIMQPYFFPYIGYWQLINAVDKYVIYDDVNFIKRGWINRNNILMNGEAKLINIQMHKASQNKLINEVEVSGNDIFNNKLLKTIEHCYKKAPFYEDVFPVIESVINQEEKNLAKFLEFSIGQVCEYLSINTNILISSDIEKNNELRAQEKVIEICKILGADVYINAIGGQDLYSSEDFSSHGIKLKFLKTGEIRYPQFDNEFVPNLSIIDLMMFNSKNAITDMLNNFVLVE
jgi:hypothetical protein